MLREAIRTMPIPGSPPRLPRVGATIGLAFVDAALRQNHIRRVSERIELLEHGSAKRSVRVDLSLSLLTDSQRTASEQYSRLRRASDSVYAQRKDPARTSWVPVARLNRRSVSPVEVHQADGSYVPRLTQSETGRLMAAAMYRLLRSILQSTPQASNTRSELFSFLNADDDSRWLVQRSLMAIAMERAMPTEERKRELATGTVLGPASRQRNLALSILEDSAPELQEYFRLLDVILTDYLVVVALPSSVDEHSLVYSAPLEAHTCISSPRYIVGSLRHSLLKPGSSYTVEYETPVSSSLRAYHLVVETATDLMITNMFLSSNAETKAASAIGKNLEYLAERLECSLSAPSETDYEVKILELEVQTSVRQLSELVRRRMWEADHTGQCFSGASAPVSLRLHDAISLGEATTDESGRLRSSLLHHPAVTPLSLREASRELRQSDLGRDLSAESDPASSRAHAYWRRPTESRAGTIDTTTVRCVIEIVDSSNLRARGVALFLVSVAALKFASASQTFGTVSFWEWPSATSGGFQSDALVAVFLLVPGFLFSRLSLPSAGTISGMLRVWTRLLAYVAIANASFLAATVAAGSEDRALAGWMLGSLILDFLCLLLLLSEFGRSPIGGDPTRTSPTRIVGLLPGWTQDPGSTQPQAVAAAFRTVGSRDGF